MELSSAGVGLVYRNRVAIFWPSHMCEEFSGRVPYTAFPKCLQLSRTMCSRNGSPASSISQEPLRVDNQPVRLPKASFQMWYTDTWWNKVCSYNNSSLYQRVKWTAQKSAQKGKYQGHNHRCAYFKIITYTSQDFYLWQLQIVMSERRL